MLLNPNVWVIELQDGSSDGKYQVSVQSTPLDKGDSHSARSEFSTCCFFNKIHYSAPTSNLGLMSLKV